MTGEAFDVEAARQVASVGSQGRLVRTLEDACDEIERLRNEVKGFATLLGFAGPINEIVRLQERVADLESELGALKSILRKGQPGPLGMVEWLRRNPRYTNVGNAGQWTTSGHYAPDLIFGVYRQVPNDGPSGELRKVEDEIFTLEAMLEDFRRTGDEASFTSDDRAELDQLYARRDELKARDD